jgi:hypothetical protein
MRIYPALTPASQTCIDALRGKIMKNSLRITSTKVKSKNEIQKESMGFANRVLVSYRGAKWRILRALDSVCSDGFPNWFTTPKLRWKLKLKISNNVKGKKLR